MALLAQTSYRLAGFAFSHLLSLLQRGLLPRWSSWTNCGPLHMCMEPSNQAPCSNPGLSSVVWPLLGPHALPTSTFLSSQSPFRAPASTFSTGSSLFLSSAWRILHAAFSSTLLGSWRHCSSHTLAWLGVISVLALPCASDDIIVREDKLLVP